MGRTIIRRIAATGLVLAVLAGAKAWHDTMRAPVVERLVVESPALPAGSQPVRIALLSDIHVAGPDMPPERLAQIVAQVNALKPDLIAIAGDLVSEKRTATHIYTAAEVIAPLGKLSAPLGVVLVPGNHDHWFGWEQLAAELARYRQITVLRNEAHATGPLVIAGVDDAFTGGADLAATMAAMAGRKGVPVVLTHSPDIFPKVPVHVPLVLAGHTHCGQIAYPWGGAPATMSDYGDLYACGVVRQHGKVLVTSAGLGTSVLPLRMFTQPEVWMIEIRPPQRWHAKGNRKSIRHAPAARHLWDGWRKRAAHVNRHGDSGRGDGNVDATRIGVGYGGILGGHDPFACCCGSDRGNLGDTAALA
jgi:predicted MPP superfamily phosphohydrolase